eukprot:gnl/Dysnectes_brevis/4765_a6564_630.p1 GENE.gnl/Dysnectes_brevis/4765_a6564_630~~gnl/Dysnectes_brevis/4765_a6564_630.p1  ORF type:complete len:191 (+),score=22.81 gnl/Dysnectes_brevis/4765_a6564_630:32-574(+)
MSSAFGGFDDSSEDESSAGPAIAEPQPQPKPTQVSISTKSELSQSSKVSESQMKAFQIRQRMKQLESISKLEEKLSHQQMNPYFTSSNKLDTKKPTLTMDEFGLPTHDGLKVTNLIKPISKPPRQVAPSSIPAPAPILGAQRPTTRQQRLLEQFTHRTGTARSRNQITQLAFHALSRTNK